MDIVGVDARCAAIDVGRLDGLAVSHAKDGQLSPVHVEARRAAMDVGKLDASAMSHAEDGCLSSDITVENRDRDLTHNVSDAAGALYSTSHAPEGNMENCKIVIISIF